MASSRWRRPVLAVAVALAGTLTIAGCVSMPSGGPVQSSAATQGPDAQAQPNVQDVAGPPRPGWSPQAIVEGFLTASASFGDNEQTARKYLTPQASKSWNPTSAIVYKDGPNPSVAHYSKPPAPKPTAKASDAPKGKAATRPETATVRITGKVQATLSKSGSYTVASASDTALIVPPFQLVKVAGQGWRIENAWDQLLLTAESFQDDYQLRKLYFFAPQTQFLVPDPIYVSLQTTSASLMDFLVNGLITQPVDWVSHGTKSAFPAGTKLIGDVSVAGTTAFVNLGGTAITRASPSVRQRVSARISAQLYWTLTGSGQGQQAVRSIELLIDGQPYIPNGSQYNPVQAQVKYNPASGASAGGTFYFLGDNGQLYSQAGAHGTPIGIEPIGTKFLQIAVSPDRKYVAALATNGGLYTGSLYGALSKRSGSGYTSLSWDRSDDLWLTANGQVTVLLPGDDRQLTVNDGGQDVTALAVAPDGVRVAMIIGDNLLKFGAISWPQPSRPGQASAQIWPSPFNVQNLTASFETVTWYGPDDVITLANPGPNPSVTDYPVDGGTSQPIPTVPNMQSISASSGSVLIARLSGNHMEYDASLTGSWEPIVTPGVSPVYPG